MSYLLHGVGLHAADFGLIYAVGTAHRPTQSPAVWLKLRRCVRQGICRRGLIPYPSVSHRVITVSSLLKPLHDKDAAWMTIDEGLSPMAENISCGQVARQTTQQL